MTPIENKTRPDLLELKRSNHAEFIPSDMPETKGIKYQFRGILNKTMSGWVIRWKRPINSVIQRPRLWADQIDWDIVKKDVAQWSLEVVIEGSIANFATHYLLGVPFTGPIMLAHGIVIVQGLSIYERLGKHGTGAEIPKKDK